eukprot:4875510-Pleurochrysis_carterae.AAC.5
MLKPTAAARAWRIDKKRVNYWFKIMRTTGVTFLPTVMDEPVVVSSTASDAPDKPKDLWDGYCASL